ncbi:Aste57867_9904 [Aphanomyces stellatus]|uniref:Aste57867_9904 protein n=1 Tax=Aphanomyces stellatus TaxID=120398 RepID=A0A485KP19_9STRA|nr:hypothetical protein As57867_009865 [Aphanomyces stellatus]VFT86783.1 Aste57867_9904 [Aphanomyces stellatus]
MKTASFLLFLVAPTTAIGCPYAVLPSDANISIVDTAICGSLFPCVVGANCSVINQDHDALYNYVGNYTGLNNWTTSLDILSANLSMAAFPERIQEISLRGAQSYIPKGFKWPASLQTITLNAYLYPHGRTFLPDSVTTITFEGGFEELSSNITWPKNLASVHFIGDDAKAATLSTKFPDTIQSMSFTGFESLTFAKEFQWPANLTTISYESIPAFFYTPVFPPSVTDVTLTTTTITLLEVLPPNVHTLTLANPLPTHETMVPNEPLQIGNLDASQLRSLKFDNCRQIANLKLGPALKYVYMGTSQIDGWLMDSTTFDALSSLTPQGNFTDSKLPANEGVEYSALSWLKGPLTITTSKATCDSNNGQLRELWPFRKPVVGPAFRANGNETENKTNFMVCVLQPSNEMLVGSNFPPAVVSTPAVKGLLVGCAAGIVLALIASVFHTMRQRHTTPNNQAKSEPPSVANKSTDDVTNEEAILDAVKPDEILC